MEIKIDKEFQKLIPPLTEEEFNRLEEKLIKEGFNKERYGCITTWNGVIVDGHNRYEICKKHDIKFETLEKEFDSREDVKIWMYDNAFAQRNMSDFSKYENRKGKAEELRKKGKEKQLLTLKQGNETPVLSNIDNTEKHNTRKIIAEELNFSTGKVAMADIVDKKAPEEIKDKLRSGDMSINQAYKEIKQAEKKEEFEEKIKKQKQDIENGKIQMPSGVFEVVVIDPPWNYGREYDPDSSRVANPYPEMNQQELLKLNPPFADDCIIFLWTTHKFIWDAKELLDKWGFEYKANLVWDKEKIGMGAWLRMQCEFCLVGIKGKPMWNNTKWRDIIREPRREHSRKPEIFYTMIEEITVGRKLNFFSRDKREGWVSYGNDTEKF